MSKKYLQTFFKEKELPFQSWDLTDSRGLSHTIDTDVVKEAILNCSDEEQAKIAHIIRQIDFKNGDVNHFLKYLAQGLIERYEGVLA